MSGSIVEMCLLLHFSRLLKVIKIKIQLIINIITLLTMVFLFGVYMRKYMKWSENNKDVFFFVTILYRKLLKDPIDTPPSFLS